MTLGMVVRADRGGLGEFTLAVAERMKPDVTVLVSLGAMGRGRTRFDAVPGNYITNNGAHLTIDAVRELLKCDVIYTAETWYDGEIVHLAERAGRRAVRHVMPELFSERGRNEILYVPTEWERHRVPGAQLLPLPVDRAKFTNTGKTTFDRRLLHITAPAMKDRNGTYLVYEALPQCKSEFTLVIHAHDYENERRKAAIAAKPPWVTIEVRDAMSAEFDDTAAIYRDMDALVLPRRYAGLCMPFQEAAASTLPIITTSNTAYGKYIQRSLLVTAEVETVVRMKGGQFPVYTCNRGLLAHAMDTVVMSRIVRDEARSLSNAMAAALDWELLQCQYEVALR